jgi:hypothetical protein
MKARGQAMVLQHDGARTDRPLSPPSAGWTWQAFASMNSKKQLMGKQLGQIKTVLATKARPPTES